MGQRMALRSHIPVSLVCLAQGSKRNRNPFLLYRFLEKLLIAGKVCGVSRTELFPLRLERSARFHLRFLIPYVLCNGPVGERLNALRQRLGGFLVLFNGCLARKLIHACQCNEYDDNDKCKYYFHASVDLARIELASPQCECDVLPLYYS